MGGKLPYRVKASIERVRELFIYNPETGEFFWTEKCAKNVKPGERAGYLDKCGYWGLTIDSVTYKAHRVAWAHVYGEWPSIDVDHIDRNRANNSIQNLRLATKSQNQANKKLDHGASKFKGVFFHKIHKKWMTQLKHNGVTKFIGYFETEEAAALAYNRSAKKLHGEFAFLNVIPQVIPEEPSWKIEAKKNFEKYMDEVIHWKGMAGKRRQVWSPTRCDMAYDVWIDCMEKQHEKVQ